MGADCVRRYKLDGELVSTFGEGGEFIAVDPRDGAILINDRGSIRVYDPTGTKLRSWETAKPGDEDFEVAEKGLSVGPDGTVFVGTGLTGDGVHFFDPDGSRLGKIDPAFSTEAYLTVVQDVAVASTGEVFVADWDPDIGFRVLRFSPN